MSETTSVQRTKGGNIFGQLGSFVRRLTEPSAALQNPVQRRKARLLALLMLALASSNTVVWGIFNFYGTATYPAVSLLWLSAIGTHWTVYGISRTRHYRIAAIAAVALTWLVGTTVTFVVDVTVAEFFVSAFILPVILSAIWFDLRGTLITVGLSIFSLGLFELRTGSLAPEAGSAILLSGVVLLIIFVQHRNQVESDRQAGLRELNAALQASEAKYRALIENVPDIIMLLECDGTIVSINRTMSGLSLQEIIGKKTVYDLMRSDHNGTVQEAVAQVFESGEKVSYEMSMEEADGDRSWYAVRVGPIKRDGQVVATTMICTDITERKRADEALRERAARLELVARVGQGTTATLETDELLRRAVNLISNTFEYYNVIILLVDGSEIVLRSATLPALWPLEGRVRLRIGSEGITGWVAGSGKPLLVPDVNREARYHASLEKMETKSEVAVPIKLKGTVIGVLDAQSTEPNAFSQADVFTLQTIADQLAIAIHNARLYKQVQQHAAELEQRVAERTAELAAVNKELEAFAYSVSHDLRAPLRSISGFSRALQEDYSHKLGAQGQDFLRRVQEASQRMGQLIDDLLKLSRLTRSEMHRETVDLSTLVQTIAAEFKQREPERQVEFVIATELIAQGDAHLLRVVLENLLSNAWKFTSRHPQARIEFGVTQIKDQPAYFVRDDGAGFDMTYAGKLFVAFQRLHAMTEFQGTGIGLATVQRIIHRHGGQVWAEGEVDKGATFYFTL